MSHEPDQTAVGGSDEAATRFAAFLRDVLDAGTFTRSDGLVGDNWRTRGSSCTDNGSALRDAQLTLINRRFLDQISDGDRSRWPLAGDQVVVDLNVGHDNLATGDRLMLGSAIVEVTSKPHTGCIKFVRRYGVDAQRFTGSDLGRSHRLRGIYVRVVEDGTAAVGDPVTKVQPTR